LEASRPFVRGKKVENGPSELGRMLVILISLPALLLSKVKA
jgi:hypothetical protein